MGKLNIYDTVILCISMGTMFSITLFCTGLIRHYAKAKQVMDIPNHRSSHTQPTPRGGGISFVGVFILFLVFGYVFSYYTSKEVIAFGVCGLGIALIGLADDRFNLSPLYRLMGHFFASVILFLILGSMPTLEVFNITFSPGWLLNTLSVLYLVWLINLYNFMDGIDGIAGLEAVSVCLSMALVYSICGFLQTAVLPLALACSVTGFLFWNIPKARIFMGDTGSAFLGYILGAMSIYSAQLNPIFFWCWLILLGVFIVDATLTLFYRALSGQKLSEAHRSHAYQWASRMYNSHFKISTIVLLINILWLFPWAVIVALGKISGSLGLVLAYIPLVFIAIRLKAGKQENI